MYNYFELDEILSKKLSSDRLGVSQLVINETAVECTLQEPIKYFLNKQTDNRLQKNENFSTNMQYENANKRLL